MIIIDITDLTMQINGLDVRELLDSSMDLQGKLSRRRVTAIDLDNRQIGGEYTATEAVSAMLPWSAPTLKRLDLR